MLHGVGVEPPKDSPAAPVVSCPCVVSLSRGPPLCHSMCWAFLILRDALQPQLQLKLQLQLQLLFSALALFDCSSAVCGCAAVLSGSCVVVLYQ